MNPHHYCVAGCARSDSPGLYTRVSSYTDWIENTTGKAVSLVGEDNAPPSLDRDDDDMPLSTILIAVGSGLAAIAFVVVGTIIGYRLRARRASRMEVTPPSSSDPSSPSPVLDEAEVDNSEMLSPPIPYGAQVNHAEQGGRMLNLPPMSEQCPTEDSGTLQSLGFYPTVPAPPPTIATMSDIPSDSENG